mgnify:CR=1 FL=1
MGFQFKNIDSLKRNREIEGTVGTTIGFKASGIALQVLAASDANPRWRELGDNYVNEYRRLQRANAPEERIKKFLAENLTRIFIIGWSGVLDVDGNEIPFTHEACVALLLEVDDIIPALLEVVSDNMKFRGARIEIISDQLKN